MVAAIVGMQQLKFGGVLGRGLIPPGVGKDWFRHHDETEIRLGMAEQQRGDGRDVFCLQSGKRTLGLVPPFHNGRTLPITSVSAIHEGRLDEDGYQTDAMGKAREPGGGGGFTVSTSDENKGLRREATDMGFAPIWYGSISYINRNQRSRVER